MEKKAASCKIKDSWLKIILACACVLAAGGLTEIYGLSDRLYFNKSFLSVLVFGASLVLVGRALDELKNGGRRAGWSLAFSWFLIFTEELGMGMRLAVNGMPAVVSGGTVLWMAVSAVPLAFFAEPMFFWLFGMSRDGDDNRPGKRELNRVFGRMWLAAFAGYLPCFLAFFPGLCCYDIAWQWEMYVSGSYNTHHPILHTLLCGWLIETGRRIFGSYNAGLAVYALFQLAVLSGSAAWAVRFLYKLQASRRIRLAAGAFYVLFPAFPVLGVSTTKDLIFGCLFLIVFVCLCDMINDRLVYKGRKLAGFLTVTVLMGLFRNNAVYGLAAFAVCLLAVWTVSAIGGRSGSFLLRLAVLSLTAVLFIEAGFTLLARGFDAQPGSVREMLSVPCQQLARTYVYHREEMSREDREELCRYIPEEALEQYQYWLSDLVKAGLDDDYLMEHKREFIDLWFRIGRQFSSEYVLAPLYNTMGIWYLGGDSSCFLEYETGPLSGGAEYMIQSDSKLPLLKKAYSWFTDANIQKYLPMVSILFYTSFYAWAVLAAGVLIIIRRRWMYLILPLYCAGYILTLSLGPGLTVRYMMGIMLCVPVLLGVVMQGMRDYDEDHND